MFILISFNFDLVFIDEMTIKLQVFLKTKIKFTNHYEYYLSQKCQLNQSSLEYFPNVYVT